MDRPPDLMPPGTLRLSAARVRRVLHATCLVTVLSLQLNGRGWCRDSPTDGPSAQCESAIPVAEAAETIPAGLLLAIARVETGRLDAVSRSIRPWPWTVNANGEGHMFETKDAAIKAVRTLQAKGVRSIDVGCLQINLLHHQHAFATLEQAFDPEANAAYGAHFLRTLFNDTLDWPAAAAAYHSQTPALGAAYRQLVMNSWNSRAAAAIGTSPAAEVKLAAATPPPLRPFTPRPLPAALSTRPDETERLLALAAECMTSETVGTASWGVSSRAPSCGRSPFSSMARLQRALRPR